MLPFKYDINKISEHRKFIVSLQEKYKKPAAKNIKIMLLPELYFFKIKNNLIHIVYRPSHLETPPYPTLLHIRGTGYNTSARFYSYITCSHLAEKSGCQVIDIDHLLAPEYPCPVPFNDVYATYKAIIEHAKQLQIDTDKIAISGYSSGGSFSALISIQAKKDKLPLALQILISPITDLSRSLKTYEYFENKDSFPKPLADWFIELYIQNYFPANDPAISPFWSNSFTSLPPTYFLFGEFDRFRSDSEAYAKKLNQFNFWTHTSLFKNENHSMFWHNIRVIEVIATQLRMGLSLTSVPQPILPTFFLCQVRNQKKESNIKLHTLNSNFIVHKNYDCS